MSCPVGRFGHRPKVESALCCPGWGGVGPFPPDSRRSHIAITQSGPVSLDCVSPVLPPGHGLQSCFLFLYLDWKGTVSRPLLPFRRSSRSERCCRPELAREGRALNSSGPPYLRGLVRAVRIYSGDGSAFADGSWLSATTISIGVDWKVPSVALPIRLIAR